MKYKRIMALPPKAKKSPYTRHYNQHMNADFGDTSTHIRLSQEDLRFARMFSDRGTLVGGIRRSLDQARKRCGKCDCCKNVTVGEPDFFARMYPSDGI